MGKKGMPVVELNATSCSLLTPFVPEDENLILLP